MFCDHKTCLVITRHVSWSQNISCDHKTYLVVFTTMWNGVSQGYLGRAKTEGTSASVGLQASTWSLVGKPDWPLSKLRKSLAQHRIDHKASSIYAHLLEEYINDHICLLPRIDPRPVGTTADESVSTHYQRLAPPHRTRWWCVSPHTINVSSVEWRNLSYVMFCTFWIKIKIGASELRDIVQMNLASTERAVGQKMKLPHVWYNMSPVRSLKGVMTGFFETKNFRIKFSNIQKL